MDSLVGPIPDGWQEVLLATVCEVVAGPSSATFKAGRAEQVHVPVITPKDLKHGKIVGGAKVPIASDAITRFDRYRVSVGDIVSVRTGLLGRHAIVDEPQEGWIIGTACFRLRPRLPVMSRYLLYYLGHPAVRDWLLRRASTATVPSLNTATLQALPVVVPPTATQAEISNILSALDKKIMVHEQIVETTQQLHEALLPLLLS